MAFYGEALPLLRDELRIVVQPTFKSLTRSELSEKVQQRYGCVQEST